jgi:hypothetical protein
MWSFAAKTGANRPANQSETNPAWERRRLAGEFRFSIIGSRLAGGTPALPGGFGLRRQAQRDAAFGSVNLLAGHLKALMQLFPQILDGRPAIHQFAAPDLLQAAGDFLTQLGGIRADEFLLRAQHSEALGNHVAGGTVMAVLQLLGDELLLLGCECDRHGSNKRQFSNAVKHGDLSGARASARFNIRNGETSEMAGLLSFFKLKRRKRRAPRHHGASRSRWGWWSRFQALKAASLVSAKRNCNVGDST